MPLLTLCQDTIDILLLDDDHTLAVYDTSIGNSLGPTWGPKGGFEFVEGREELGPHLSHLNLLICRGWSDSREDVIVDGNPSSMPIPFEADVTYLGSIISLEGITSREGVPMGVDSSYTVVGPREGGPF